MTIKYKLISIIMATCIVALLLAGIILILWEWSMLRHTMARNLSTQAEMIAENCKASLTFNDPDDAKATLSALHVESSIIFGGVYNKKGELFAAYYHSDVAREAQPSELQKSGYTFGEGFLTVFKAIILDDETIGVVCVRSDLHPMYAVLKRNTEIVAAVLLLASTVAYYISSRLQNIISAPILSLAESARTIGRGHFDHRVEVQSRDELGYLALSFNNMADDLRQTMTSIDNLHREISDRKRAEQALQASESKYRMLLESLPQKIFLKDRKSVYLSCNDNYARDLKIEREQIAGRTDYDFYPKELADKYRADDKRVMESGKVESLEEKYLLDSQEIFVQTVKTPVKDNEGNVTGVLGIFWDISERKKTEERLQEAESRLRQALLASNVGTWKWDIISNQDTRDAAFNNMLGLEQKDTTHPVEDFVGHIHPEDRGSVEAEIQRSIKEHDVYKVEFRIVRPNGEIRWLSDRGETSYDNAGKVSFMTGAVVDITERKKADKALEKLNKDLELAVLNLGRSNKELQDFAYVVSHDLKAPLRGIKTLASWMSTDYADKLDQNGKEQMRLLVSRVDRMHNLIDGVLQYSRVGRVKENKVQINLNEFISEVIDMVAPPENISIMVENELPVVECERTRMTQVFQNLLSNAVKYMDKPQGQVRIGCIEEDGFWKFSVADNGPGIEEKYFEKIFQMFQTLAPRDDVESTGVGLTVAKKIVELYGGKIWVESKVGQGSTFIFTLPKQEKEVTDAKLQASTIS
jgi:PAS domain S-box-containing protein